MEEKHLTYEQRTGRLLDSSGNLLAKCYSGIGPAKNNPACQMLIGQGPIPQGMYTLSAVEYVNGTSPHGPYVIVLTPDKGNTMFGRAGFLMHADSIHHPGQASFGCIVVLGGLDQREKIWTQTVHRLMVVAGDQTVSPPNASQH